MTLSVCDASGRCVINLADEQFQRGTHRLVWDGTDSHGTPVASGVYLKELKSGVLRLAQKLSHVKKDVFLGVRELYNQDSRKKG